MELVACDNPFSLEDLATRIRKSSNFRFDWQFYRVKGIDLCSASEIRNVLNSIIDTPDLHQFLRESFEPLNARVRFEIKPLHEHCQVVADADGFENVLASAAGDHLGAYSRELRDANASEKQEIRKLFRLVGDYCAYQLLPGKIPGYQDIDYESHLFTTWFDGIAWDWCLFATWPDQDLLWMGCLTDTD